MTTSSKPPSDLFAAKGRAMPACSKPLVSRPARGPAQAAAPKPDQTGAKAAKARDDGPASVLSIDLRRALVPARSVSPRIDPPQASPSGIAAPGRDAPTPAISASPGAAAPPPPQNHGMAGPLIAAIVATSIAGGAFYILERDRFGVTPATDAPAAASAETVPPEDPALSVASDPPQDLEAVDRGADAAPEDGSLPSFDLVRVEPDGSAVIAGRAAPYADLILLHNGEPIGKVRADWAGEWAFVTDQPLPADRHQITILVNEPDAKITLPEGAAPPAQVSGMANTRPR